MVPHSTPTDVIAEPDPISVTVPPRVAAVEVMPELVGELTVGGLLAAAKTDELAIKAKIKVSFGRIILVNIFLSLSNLVLF